MVVLVPHIIQVVIYPDYAQKYSKGSGGQTGGDSLRLNQKNETTRTNQHIKPNQQSLLAKSEVFGDACRAGVCGTRKP